MRTVELKAMGSKDLEVCALPESIRQSLKNQPVFWLGSISITDQQALHRFLELARESDVEEMAKHGCLEKDFAYGLLIQDRSTPSRYWLGVFEASNDLWLDDECLFWGAVDGLVVAEKRALEPEIPKARLTWRDVLRAFFRW